MAVKKPGPTDRHPALVKSEGFGGGVGRAGSRKVSPSKQLDSAMTDYARGKISASNLRARAKKAGFHIDSLRGNSSVIDVFKIGKDGKPTGRAIEKRF